MEHLAKEEGMLDRLDRATRSSWSYLRCVLRTSYLMSPERNRKHDVPAWNGETRTDGEVLRTIVTSAIDVSKCLSSEDGINFSRPG